MDTKDKYKRPQIEVICNNPKCKKHFMKDGSEVRRNEKRGSDNYCSLTCFAKVNHGQIIKDGKNLKNLLIGYNKSDKYTGLREHLNRVKNGGRGQNYDITLDDLLTQWISQKGICTYTGIELIHPKNAKGISLIYKASLDRIDSKLGYIKGNIQFISAAANMAKNNMTHEEMIMFCQLITNNFTKK